MNAGVGDLEVLLASISLFALLLYNLFLLRLMQVVNLLLSFPNFWEIFNSELHNIYKILVVLIILLRRTKHYFV